MEVGAHWPLHSSLQLAASFRVKFSTHKNPPGHVDVDSSSNDCIEEAIQLYQLEKRNEASGDPPQETPPREEQPDPPAHGTSHATKSALPETHRKMPGKEKPVASKAMDLSLGGLDPDCSSKPPKETKVPAPPVAKSEFVDRSSCWATHPPS